MAKSETGSDKWTAAYRLGMFTMQGIVLLLLNNFVTKDNFKAYVDGHDKWGASELKAVREMFASVDSRLNQIDKRLDMIAPPRVPRRASIGSYDDFDSPPTFLSTNKLWLHE